MAAWCTGRFVRFYCHAVVFSNMCVGTKCGIMRSESCHDGTQCHDCFSKDSMMCFLHACYKGRAEAKAFMFAVPATDTIAWFTLSLNL